ncbi:hypothetical protein F8M41_001948 [Gigaspora margarita]|uniref:Uncharacterized protein n=1 Tax=Gigaspora margarita TaxID=4874 RepID=A0A8H4A9M3_GIGMA|nr:hypothetical protein F8M41_001948 [Gigaspora margarita]
MAFWISEKCYNYMVFWIAEKCNLLKGHFPQIYKILVFPYSLYLSSFTIYPKETVILIFPLLNFATYPDIYSYCELFNVKDNSFTLLSDEPSYFKFWNVKALIKFK